ncbi:MAG: hypothetical protein II525_06080 [Bacteroidales bacterium]|nr:hypothetical protein [Bacteroidales bacterium]
MTDKNFESLRQAHPTFTYRAYHWEKREDCLQLQFYFEVNEEIRFSPTIRIPDHPAYATFYKEHNLNELENLVFHIGMIELISYWKCVCCPEIRIEAAHLDEEALAWWKNLYYHGLGEFFYINHIATDAQSFVRLRCTSDRRLPKLKAGNPEGTIIPIGGGKDSVVTLELLKQQQPAPLTFIINPRGATKACAEISGLPGRYLEIQRPIDKRLLELNAEGYLNGHTPFSAMLAFYSLLIATLAGRSRIALSNESSANEPTVQGSDVNHQYSKSIAFESDFREYVAKHLTEGISYHSFLRPLSELQIAMLFSRCTAYLPVFRSCNVGSKQDIWCGHCPKCLFTCIMLSAFLPAEKVREIFGKDLLEDETLWPVLKELCGETAVKPFECVGTREEVCMALCEIIRQYESRNKSLPTLLASFRRTALYEAYRQRDIQPLLTAWDPQHFLPEDEELLLRKALGI